jgi:hypothetical protein
MDQRPADTPPPPSPSTSPRNLNSKSPSPTPTSSTLQTLFFDAVEAANPPLRQLASHSTLGSLPNTAVADLHSSRFPVSKVSGATFDEQRHPGKAGAAINKTTRELETSAVGAGSSASPPDAAVKSGGPGYLSTESGSSSSQNCSPDEPLIGSKKPGAAGVVAGRGQETEKEAENEAEGGIGPGVVEDEESIYPGRVALTLIIIGLCLSVFLISLDRTIITTVGTNPKPKHGICRTSTY